MNRRRLSLGVLASLAVVVTALVLFACSQTPTAVPVRTFERAQKVDFVCLRLADASPAGLVPRRPIGVPLGECTQTPPDADGASFPTQLFALVTQSARGEVAVVNLTSGVIMDVNAKTPNFNFLPVGTVPTDIASAPDGQMTFVASAEPNKPAIYGLPSARILGDKAAVRSFDAAGRTIDLLLPPDPLGAPALTSWPVCSLPQAPAALSVVPREGGAGYELVAVLPGDRLASAKVVTIDPRPFLVGAGVIAADAGLPADGGAVAAPVMPGSLAPCPILAATELGGEDLLPPTFRVGAKAANGIPYVDAGALDLTCDLPRRTASCGAPPCCAEDFAPAPVILPDGGDPGPAPVGPTADELRDGGACADLDQDAGEIPLQVGPLDPPRVVALARDGTTIYLGDEAVPFVHVLDLSQPGTIVERAPLLATSLTEPTRPVGIRALAVSPPTRDYQKFLYAVDAQAGSILVYDVSAPSDTPRLPLTRPFPELDPFQPPDRVRFTSPVVAVEFARADVPITVDGNVAGVTGALCNPNPNVVDPKVDPGVAYRANSASPSSAYGDFGPRRLRGVFGFVTLASGSVVVIDVDDWDAPCRRPALLTEVRETDPNTGTGRPARAYSSVARAQALSPSDPYGAPEAAAESTSDEAYFPVSLPHRLRSAVFLRASTTTGKQIPYVSGLPTVAREDVILPVAGVGSEATPLLRPTREPGAEEALTPGIRFSFEAPEVHIDQDWTVTYEGALPGFDGYNAIVSTEDGFRSLVLKQPGAKFCSKGVEDWSLGRDRAAAITAAVAGAGRRAPVERLDRRIADYVQITSDLLGPDDPYWSVPESALEGGSCWQATDAPGSIAAPGRARYDLCNAVFGAPAEEGPGRDFPILEAYDDKLVLGRFFTFPNDAVTPTREVIWKDDSNRGALKLAQCCFHGQAKFRVRGGGQWVAVGSALGFLSHLVPGEGGRCVDSCDPREALLSSRAPAVPRSNGGQALPAPSRDSILALRNPLFSFFVENGETAGRDLAPIRNTQWKFTTRGQFQALSIALGGQSANVNPQSMRFVAPLGQVAIVDASNQGLVLVDLRSVSIARAPFF